MKYLKEYWASILVLILVVVLSIGTFFIDLNAFQQSIKDAGIWAPVFYILAKTSTVVFAPLSGTALYVFSVPLFGFWKGLLYSFIGDLIGATITFYLSRWYGQPVIKYFTGKKNLVYIESVLDIMSTFKGFVSVRLAALVMPEIASYAAGLTKLRFRDFIYIHMIIDIVPIVVMTMPGLLFSQNLPIWFGVATLVCATLVTIVSVSIFVRMVHAHVKTKTNLVN
jgi:uncharacterized membrane protein YdjX (TVP38/TMEM64 family)